MFKTSQYLVDSVKVIVLMGGGLGKESLQSLVSVSGYHCVMIGLDNSGKTTILYRIKYGQYTNTTHTIGFNCEKV